MTSITIIDGPIGTEIELRGISTTGPLWSANAIQSHPDAIVEIHQSFVDSGATVHATPTFRTQRRYAGPSWAALTQQAVALTRISVPEHHTVAGSLAPLADCYRPDLSPTDSLAEHSEMARELAVAGSDLIFCETFANGDEAIVAVTAARATGLKAWLSLTAGPNADLMTPAQMAQTAQHAVEAGASAILVNCVPAHKVMPFVQSLADANLKVPLGVYANAGHDSDPIGWQSNSTESASRYVEFARQWVDCGATILGGCCGIRPHHIQALHNRFAANQAGRSQHV